MPQSPLSQYLFSLEEVLFFHQHLLRSFDSFVHPRITLHILDWRNLLAAEKSSKHCISQTESKLGFVEMEMALLKQEQVHRKYNRTYLIDTWTSANLMMS